MLNSIVDNMKKECKIFIFVMILGYVLSIVFPIAIYLTKNEKYSIYDIVAIVVSFLGLGTIGLYGFLYGFNYKIEITEEKILLKTLFKKREIYLNKLDSFICKRYRKSMFHQFKLFSKEKKYLIYTRYKDELYKLLKQNNINEKM